MSRELLRQALDALEEIALAGMSGTGQESPEGMTEWHARQAWKFIRIAARAMEPIRAELAKPEPAPLTDEAIEQAYNEAWRSLPSDFGHTSGDWFEAGARFAAALAAQQAVADERERCAKLCDLHSRLTWNDDRKAQSRVLATEIRRGAAALPPDGLQGNGG